VSPIYKKVPTSYQDRYLPVSNMEHTHIQNDGGKDSNFTMRTMGLTKALKTKEKICFKKNFGYEL